jgi:hypothetical protein
LIPPGQEGSPPKQSAFGGYVEPEISSGWGGSLESGQHLRQ